MTTAERILILELALEKSTQHMKRNLEAWHEEGYGDQEMEDQIEANSKLLES